MKNLLLIFFTFFTLMSCEKDSAENLPLIYSIEGKWLFDLGAGLPNTMYEFKDGVRYTYYADTNDWSLAYWESLDISDAIPGTNDYIFSDNILTIDLNFGNIGDYPLIFECDGDRINVQDPNSPDRYDWIRLGADFNDCN